MPNPSLELRLNGVPQPQPGKHVKAMLIKVNRTRCLDVMFR